MPAPDFFVIGAAKSGTTALWHWLRAHPGVFLPAGVKEPSHFAVMGSDPRPRAGPFDPDYVARIASTPEAYARLYAPAGGRRSGDVSPAYLHDAHARGRIAAARPDARIVILLRDPVERAMSQYRHHRRDGLEPLGDPASAFAAEAGRREAGWSWGHSYLQGGHYADALERWAALFPRESILCLTHEAMRASPEAVWARICAHLDLPPRPLDGNRAVNVSNRAAPTGRPALVRRLRHPGPVQRLAKRALPPGLRGALRPLLEGRPRPPAGLSPADRRALAARYRAERPRLEALTGLDLGHWG